MNVVGTRVLVTGGSGAIGLAIANRFLDLGKQVVLCDIDTGPGDALAAKRGGVTTIACDLADSDAIETHLGPLFAGDAAPEILCNNVGISPKFDAAGKRLDAWSIPIEQWDRVMAINLRSYFHCAQLAIPGMIERGYGRIINTGSISARIGSFASLCHYTASKSAVLGLTKALGRELGPHGITVNAVNPSRIDTELNHQEDSDALNAAYTKNIPLGRLAEPDDIAKTVLFLASDLADFMTGTAVEVNGGYYVGP